MKIFFLKLIVWTASINLVGAAFLATAPDVHLAGRSFVERLQMLFLGRFLPIFAVELTILGVLFLVQKRWF